jgi:hypothetical protein
VLLKELSVVNKGKSVMVLPEIALENGSVDLVKQAIHIENVKSKNLTLTAIKAPDGTFDFNSFVKQTEPPAAKAPAKQDDMRSPKSAQPKPWTFSMASADLTGYQLILVDQSLATPATLRAHDIDLKVSDFSTTASPAKVDFSVGLNNAGTIKASGTTGISPLAATLNIKVVDVAFKPFQSYISEHLNLGIISGSLSSKGRVTLVSDSKKGPVVSFNGSSSINDFSVIDSLSKTELARWQKLNLSDIAFISSPVSLNIDAISLDAPFAKIVLSDSGDLNFLEIQKKTAADADAKQDAPPEPEQPTDSEPIKITVGTFSVADGQLDFTDYKINPAFSTTLSDFGGKIKGLSSAKDSKADVLLAGKLNRFSPLKVSGTVNPLAEKLFADLKIDFNDIDLSPASPYTGKFLGYKTDKGKLTLNLRYQIDDKKINSQNHAFLDQFTLGDEVDSPDAVNLPIHLALALLENRKGEIDLNIPVEGDLDDPEFSVGSVVTEVIFNLITKAVTSPFALLGALIPDGDDLQYIPFEPGQDSIAPENIEKLPKIASILYERPGLRMDIIGKIDPRKDRDAINEYRFQKMLKEQIVADINVSDEALRLLANRRAANVKNYLVETGKVEAERLFLIEPEITPTDSNNIAIRVDLVIK